jgi:dolichol-phosphate mannosyltransferase
MKKNLSIIIPAYNEDKNVERVVSEVIDVAINFLDNYEIIIVNDGSKDKTLEIISALSERNNQISVINFKTNQGVGAAYKSALNKASYEFITLIPGDGAFTKQSLEYLFKAVGKAEMVISFRSNPEARSVLRKYLSKICTAQLRLTTRCPIKDGHSLYVWPTQKARQIDVTPDYSYHLITLVNLFKVIGSYAEVPAWLTPNPDKSSGVLKINVVTKLGFELTKLTLKSLITKSIPRPKKITINT